MIRTGLLGLLFVLFAATADAQSFDARFRFETAGSPASSAAVAPTLRDADRDGRFDDVDLFDAALLAGGTSAAERRAEYRQRFERLLDELRLSGRVVGSEQDRARTIHEFLHARLLTGGFRETATTLDAAFDFGRFNCISSVILFRLASERFGLRVHGIEVPGHAYAIVETAGQPLIVQTTCPAWFSVLGNEAASRALLQRTLGTQAATEADRDPTADRRLTDVGLTAVVVYNLGLDHLEAGRFAEALAANQKSLEWDGLNTAARANLLATLNNWSLARFKAGQAREALRLLEQGLAVAPDYDLFHENLIAVYQQALAKTGAADGESAEHRAALRGCYVRWHDELVRRGKSEAAARVANRAETDPFLQAAP